MSTEKTYLVTFSVHDCYRITLTAASEEEALEKAENLYCEENEDAFELDFSVGGTSDWEAVEVQS